MCGFYGFGGFFSLPMRDSMGENVSYMERIEATRRCRQTRKLDFNQPEAGATVRSGRSLHQSIAMRFLVRVDDAHYASTDAAQPPPQALRRYGICGALDGRHP